MRRAKPLCHGESVNMRCLPSGDVVPECPAVGDVPIVGLFPL
jgi:hypothetical protein